MDYLKSYRQNKKLLAIDRYERERAAAEEDTELFTGETFLRASMFEVRRFILCLENGDEKLFLYYYYIKGETMEKCAQLLEVSERTVFRIKKRAHELAARKLFPE